MLKINIRKATHDDADVIHQLAEKIWNKHYLSIITQEQINYMLDKMYSPVSLKKQMDEQHNFSLAYINEQPVGYISVNETTSHNYFLNKLYVDTHVQRTGIGSALYDHVINDLHHIENMRLQVNRKNYRAINFYFKKGFMIEEVKDFDIGNNYFMNDFIMVKKYKNNN